MHIMHIQTGHSLTNDIVKLDNTKTISFVAEDGHTMFEVSIRKDQKSIEIRSVDCVKINNVVYNSLEMTVKPRFANVIEVSLLPCHD